MDLSEILVRGCKPTGIGTAVATMAGYAIHFDLAFNLAF
jgi:hypothetical protein